MCLKCTQEYGAEKTKYDVRYINNVCFCSFDVLRSIVCTKIILILNERTQIEDQCGNTKQQTFNTNIITTNMQSHLR